MSRMATQGPHVQPVCAVTRVGDPVKDPRWKDLKEASDGCTRNAFYSRAHGSVLARTGSAEKARAAGLIAGATWDKANPNKKR